MRFPRLCMFVLSAFVTLSSRLTAETELFVSLDGNDSAEGTTANTPLATIAEAQRRIRELRQVENFVPQTFRVLVAGGRYELTEPLEFSLLDSGTEEYPVHYVGSSSEPTVLSGGLTVDCEDLGIVVDDPRLLALPESIRGNIRCIDLRRHGLQSLNKLNRRARHENMLPAGTELFVNHQRQQLSGWPNAGWATINDIDTTGKQWIVEGLQNTGALDHPWARGFFANDWQDHFEPVKLQGNRHGSHTCAFENPNAPRLRRGARYRIENVLSQLDSESEYYLDRERLRLYVFARNSHSPDSMYLSNLETPVSLYDVEHVTLSNFTIEGSRVCGVEIAGGRNVTLENCTIKNIGNIGINIFHGYQHTVSRCEVYNTGAGAIRVDGGDRRTLFASEFLIENCTIHDFAQLQLAYRPAINVYGVGTTILKNRISHGPHAAIILHGNDHLVQYNDIHEVCRETEDVGAIYMGHDPTFRGNQIRNNHLHDLGGFSRIGVIGVYLDDFASGTEVAENIFERACRGVAIGGGRDNTIENNLFIECLAAVQIDCRGTTWASGYFEGQDSFYAKQFAAVSVAQEIYAERYPGIFDSLQDDPQVAKGNRILRNLYDGPIGIDLHDNLTDQVVHLDQNFGKALQLLAATPEGEYQLRKGAETSNLRFKSLSLKSVGPQAESAKLVSEHNSILSID